MIENNPTAKRFGEIISNARKAKSLTQQKLGEACGYTGRSAELMVQAWEHDRKPIPIDRLRRLCAALDLPLDALIP